MITVNLRYTGENGSARSFAGEMMDVDGICGGYNLQWCWTSGEIAGGLFR